MSWAIILDKLTDSRSIHAIANTSHDTADNQMREGVGARLQSGTNDHDHGTSEDSLATAKVVTNPDTGDGADETAQVVGSSRDTLDCGASALLSSGETNLTSFGGVDLGEGSNERVQGQ